MISRFQAANLAWASGYKLSGKRLYRKADPAPTKLSNDSMSRIALGSHMVMTTTSKTSEAL
jgi:hypothetical protein